MDLRLWHEPKDILNARPNKLLRKDGQLFLDDKEDGRGQHAVAKHGECRGPVRPDAVDALERERDHEDDSGKDAEEGDTACNFELVVLLQLQARRGVLGWPQILAHDFKL